MNLDYRLLVGDWDTWLALVIDPAVPVLSRALQSQVIEMQHDAMIDIE